MGRAPCCDKAKVKRGPWSTEEDAKLKSYIQEHGTGGNWIALPQKIGLKRCGKSCRLRWLNYLRPNIKHGGFSDEEDNIICALYMTIGSRWSIIAAQLPGRTDNDIKNYWNTKLKKKLLSKQRKEIQELAAGRSNTSTTTTTNSSNIVIKSENPITAQDTINYDQSPYWPQHHQLPIYPSSSQQQNINITSSNFYSYPEKISTINDFDQLYDNLDFRSITSLSPVNNYTTCFQLPNNAYNDFQAFNNFAINEMVEPTLVFGSMEKVNGTTSTSAESTVSWGGDHINSNFVCSPMVSMSSYQDIDRPPQEMQPCGFQDQNQYLGFPQ